MAAALKCCCFAAAALLALHASLTLGARVSRDSMVQRHARKLNDADQPWGLPNGPIPINISKADEYFGKDGLVKTLNLTGYLDGLAGYNYTEMDGTTLGGKKHYEDMHNSDLVVNKDEFSFGGGDNKDSNDTGLEAGYGGGLTQKKDGNFSAGGGGGFTIHEFDPKKLNVGGGFGIEKGLAASNGSSSSYSPYVPPHAP